MPERARKSGDAGRPSVPTRAVSLRGVLDDRQVVVTGDVVQSCHVGELAVEVDREYEARAFVDRSSR